MCSQPSRPTQPPTFCETGNEYRLKCGDFLRPGLRQDGSFHSWMDNWTCGWQVKLCDPLNTCHPEGFRDEFYKLSAIQIYALTFTYVTQIIIVLQNSTTMLGVMQQAALCPSLCPSHAGMCCIKIAGDRITLFSCHYSSSILVFFHTKYGRDILREGCDNYDFT